jgi:exonuclease SbcD
LRPFTFIHAADLHLGCPFKGLGVSNPEVARAVDRATYAAFERIVQLAVDSQAAFVLFSGDIHDCADRNLKAQLQFNAGVRRLDELGIATCIIAGNHDYLGGEQANLKWPSSTKMFAATKDEPKIIEVEGEAFAAIYGYSYPKRHIRESKHHLCRPREQDSGLFKIAMLHANVGGKGEHDNYCPCTVQELSGMGIDYWALGHVHGHEILHPESPTIVYPGSPQGLSIREGGVHGCCVVKVNADRKCEVEFTPTDSIRWHHLDVSIEGLAGPLDWLDRSAHVLEQLSKEGALSHIVRINAVGRGALHRTLQTPGTTETFLDELRTRFTGTPFVWVDQIRVDTQPLLNIAARRQTEDLTGDFLRLCDKTRADQDGWEPLLKELEPVFGRQELAYLLPNAEQHLEDWLRRAEIMGAEHLIGEEQE